MGFLDKIKDTIQGGKSKQADGGFLDQVKDKIDEAQAPDEVKVDEVKADQPEVGDGPVITEADKPAPKKAEPEKAEPKKAEAKKAEAKKAEPKKAAPQKPELKTYTVKSGDTLSEIGAKYGVSYMEIAKLNNIENPDLIFPGQVFKIPNK